MSAHFFSGGEGGVPFPVIPFQVWETCEKSLSSYSYTGFSNLTELF